MLSRLKNSPQIPEDTPDAVLQDLIEGATRTVLNYTRRKTLPEELESMVVKLAKNAYARIGAEGESAHSEGGVSRTYTDELSADTKAELNRFIKARVV